MDRLHALRAEVVVLGREENIVLPAHLCTFKRLVNESFALAISLETLK